MLYIYIYLSLSLLIYLFIEGSLEVNRSQTSDNMDRWKAEMGRVREEEEKKKDDKKRENLRKKTRVREKVGKLRSTVFFQWFVAPEGRKVSSPKRRMRSHVVRWEMKSCTPLWREAQLQVKKEKAPHVRSTFRSCDVEKVHAVVARSTFPSENVQNTPASDHFWKLRCSKSVRRLGAKHISKSKCTKHHTPLPSPYYHMNYDAFNDSYYYSYYDLYYDSYSYSYDYHTTPGQKFFPLTSCCNLSPWTPDRFHILIPTWNTIRHAGHAKWV